MVDFILVFTTTALVIEYVILALLITSYLYKRKGKFRLHGKLMLPAVVLHSGTILLVMVPLLLGVIESSSIFSGLKALILIHALLGVTAWGLGVYIVGSWRLRQELIYCQPKKRLMLATYIVWFLAIALGTIVYLGLYGSLFG